ncbi:MAG TPA: protein-L-isoaspartate(D-aspartate) O-methyltransferase [Rhizomicrobium sp.]|jgi:protein-L-isoaspartate(D-aspartate) O-methyltransferase
MTHDPRIVQLLMDLRRQGIGDLRVLSTIERTPREVFVDKSFDYAAYNNTALPIACGQTISQPYVVAYMTQVLDVPKDGRVLELGTGSGYQAAVLAQLCRRVYTIERHRPLMREARVRFEQLKLHNIVTKHGDGLKGWPEQAPFDRILCSAAMDEVPQILIDQLKAGGILVAPIGIAPKSDEPESFSQQLTKIMKTEDGVKREALIPVLFVPMLPGLPQENSDVRRQGD